jgi:hypothetical protein
MKFKDFNVYFCSPDNYDQACEEIKYEGEGVTLIALCGERNADIKKSTFPMVFVRESERAKFCRFLISLRDESFLSLDLDELKFIFQNGRIGSFYCSEGTDLKDVTHTLKKQVLKSANSTPRVLLSVRMPESFSLNDIEYIVEELNSCLQTEDFIFCAGFEDTDTISLGCVVFDA